MVFHPPPPLYFFRRFLWQPTLPQVVAAQESGGRPTHKERRAKRPSKVARGRSEERASHVFFLPEEASQSDDEGQPACKRRPTMQRYSLAPLGDRSNFEMMASISRSAPSSPDSSSQLSQRRSRDLGSSSCSCVFRCTSLLTHRQTPVLPRSGLAPLFTGHMQLASAIDKFSLNGGEQDSAAGSSQNQTSPMQPAWSPLSRRPLSQQLIDKERPSLLRYDSWHGAEQLPADEAAEQQANENALTSAAAFLASIPRPLMPWATTAMLPPVCGGTSAYRTSDTLGMQSFMSADSLITNASPTCGSTPLGGSLGQESAACYQADDMDTNAQPYETNDSRDDASDCGSGHSLFL